MAAAAPPPPPREEEEEEREESEKEPSAKKQRVELSKELVHIPVVNEGGLENEVMLFELQGKLMSADGKFAGHKVGDLETREGTPYLTIGIHQLEGKFVDLEKPVLILKREDAAAETKFVIEAIVRRKVLFKTRPKLLIRKEAATVAAADPARKRTPLFYAEGEDPPDAETRVAGVLGMTLG